MSATPLLGGFPLSGDPRVASSAALWAISWPSFINRRPRSMAVRRPQAPSNALRAAATALETSSAPLRAIRAKARPSEGQSTSRTRPSAAPTFAPPMILALKGRATLALSVDRMFMDVSSCLCLGFSRNELHLRHKRGAPQPVFRLSQMANIVGPRPFKRPATPRGASHEACRYTPQCERDAAHQSFLSTRPLSVLQSRIPGGLLSHRFRRFAPRGPRAVGDHRPDPQI